MLKCTVCGKNYKECCCAANPYKKLEAELKKYKQAEADGRLIIKNNNEVYKCKNCKHLEPSKITNRLYCSYHSEGDNQYETYKDDYCSYFEKSKQN